MLTIKICPTCGSKRIKKVRRTLIRQAGAARYQVPDLEFYECPACGERLFDRAASKRIDALSPALTRHAKRRSA